MLMREIIKELLSGYLQGLFLFLRSGRFLMTHFGKKQITAIFLPGSLNAGVRIFFDKSDGNIFLKW
jgi:hypothetical protein